MSTLESKLQKIENLDKAVEHLMRRVEMLDSRVTNNIDKTDSVISKLQNLDLKLFSADRQDSDLYKINATPRILNIDDKANILDMRLVSLDQKVSDIDNKLVGLKNQLDTNFLPADDINAEASEKKPISMNVVDIAKVLNAELMTHVSRELDGLRSTTTNVDRKLQFHINLVSENLGKVLSLVKDVHEAIVDTDAGTSTPPSYRNRTTTTQSPPLKNSKLDKLVRQIHPIMSVSEKMDEVWDVVVGTKSSVDGLVPKSDELLTHTQRQERAINDIHTDLRTKANKIIANLDLVEKRLKKQEDNVANLAQRPVPAELLLDPTIDRLVEYDQNKYLLDDVVSVTEIPSNSYTTSSTPPSTTTPYLVASGGATNTPTPSTPAPAPNRAVNRNRGVIFPSVKNKPSLANSTFTTDVIASIKDIKVRRHRRPME
jgi:uncharacterized protein YoxC